VRLLFARLTWLTVKLVPNDSGMLPSRRFLARFRVWSCGSLPNSLGMAPVIPLLPRFTCHKDVRFAMQLDISPRRCEEPRSRVTTRVGSPLLQVTPFPFHILFPFKFQNKALGLDVSLDFSLFNEINKSPSMKFIL
jgi:hypothetical protein